MNSDMLSISQAAAVIGVSISTMRRWDRESIFCCDIRTSGGHRRYSLKVIRKVFFGEQISASQDRPTVLYSRVSSSDQSKDLERQAGRLRVKAEAERWDYVEIQDIGSGLNCKKRGLRKLLNLICLQQISRLVLTHKDRLLRFGSEMLFQLCKEFGIEIVVLDAQGPKSFEEELAAEMIDIITVSSARLYGKRSHQNKKKYKEAA